MVFKFIIFVAAALFQAHVVLGNNNSRIVNGIRASLGEFPYQISLQQNGAHNCGGSILNANYVLTAAHCLTGSSPRQLRVIAGTVDLGNLRAPASTHSVTRILNHENYQESNSWNNDIALLQISPPFSFSRNIAAARLPAARSVIRDNSPATISGFGRTWRNAPTSRTLLKTDVNVISQASCRRFNRNIRPTTVCAVNSRRVTGFCNGDSGGPLTLNGVVVGIVSYSYNFGCAGDERIPQVFTRVSEYIGWINARIR